MKGSKPRPWSASAGYYRFHGFAFAAAMLNAGAVAGVRQRLYCRKKTARKLYESRPVEKKAIRWMDSDACPPTIRTKAMAYGFEIEEITEPHPISEVRRRGSGPYCPGYQLDLIRMVDLQFTGQWFQYRVRDPVLGIPVQIWRMAPQWTQVVPDKPGGRLVKEYLYGADPTSQDTFPAKDVDHITLIRPTDMHYGRGWIEAAWTALGLHEGKREMDTARVDNYARPDFVVSLVNANSTMGADVLNTVKDTLKEQLQGTDKTGNFAVVAGDTKITPLNFDEKEYGTPERVIEEIAAVSGVPVSMLLQNDANRANAEAGRLGWYRNTVRMYVNNDVETQNATLVPCFTEAEDVFLCYDPVSFEDREALVKEAVGLVGGGIWTADDARIALGDQPMEVPESTQLYPPAGAGASASAGNVASGQNNRRRNEDA